MAGHKLVRYVIASLRGRRLVQDNFVVQVWSGIAREVRITPFHIEYAVRGNAGSGNEHSTGRTCSSDGILVYPERTYGIGSGGLRQARDAKTYERITKGQHAVRAHGRGGEALAVQRDREREGDGDTAVIAVHAEATRPCDKRAGAGRKVIGRDASRRWRASRRCRWRGRWARR